MHTLDDFKEKEHSLFKNGEYIVYSEKANDIKPGDIIYLTTSKFMYDCVCGVFMRDIRKSAKVKVEIMNEDLSEYVPGKHTDGGCYAYATAKVIEVLGED